jgi:hypothetical protein
MSALKKNRHRLVMADRVNSQLSPQPDTATSNYFSKVGFQRVCASAASGHERTPAERLGQNGLFNHRVGAHR